MYVYYTGVTHAIGIFFLFVADQYTTGQGERGSQTAVKGWKERVSTYYNYPMVAETPISSDFVRPR